MEGQEVSVKVLKSKARSMSRMNPCLADCILSVTEFDAEECPPDCSRPCENVCPADAISLEEDKSPAHFSYGTKMLNVLKVLHNLLFGVCNCSPISLSHCHFSNIHLCDQN